MNNKEKVLKMVKDGILDIDEAMKLLEALSDQPLDIRKTPQQQAKMLRVKILSHDGDVVKINVPISLIKAGADLANKIKIDGQPLDTKGVDIDLIMQAIQEGATGEIVDIASNDGDVVKIYID